MLTLKTAPASYPVTVAELKAHLAIDISTEDTRLGLYLAAATSLCEVYTGRAFVSQTWKLNLDSFPDGKIYLPKPPLTSVTHIKYYDESNVLQTWDNTNYHVMTPTNVEGWIEPLTGETYPATYTRPDAIEIQFVCGYPETSGALMMPAQVEMAIKFICACWNENRGDEGDKTDLPQGAKALLDQLKVWRVD